MAKIHLRRNKADSPNGPLAACATHVSHSGDGNLWRNNRNKYQHMTSIIVSMSDFKATPIAERCAHCMEVALPILNLRRANKGLPPVTKFDSEE